MKTEKKYPPKLAQRFFRWFCHPKLLKHIEGDLLELYEERIIAKGKWKADFRFVIDVLLLLRPGIIRPRQQHPLNQSAMFKSYFKITYRNILKNKTYSLINIFGLSLGIACCILMFNYVQYETSYDNFHPALNRTFRVDRQIQSQFISSSAPPLGHTLQDNYPEVEEVMRINTPGDFIVRFEEQANQVLAFNETHVFAADSNFFSFFGFKLKEGNPLTALSDANKVVISAEVATKFFSNEPAIGKFLLFGDERKAIEITGVTEIQPQNTHFHFDYLLSMETNPNVKKRDWSWVWTQVVTYVRLKPSADPQQLETKMAGLAEKIIKPALESRGMNYSATEGTWNFILRPMRDIHLKSGDNRLGTVGNIKYVYAFGVIGIFVLVIAAINFINLSTARGTKRAKEVGVKKTLGAARSSLVTQFQFESIFLAVCSTVLALGLVEALRLIISDWSGVNIPVSLWQEKETMLSLPLSAIVIGFVAGLYPSFYLTAFRPGQVLKGKIAAGLSNTMLRSGLVIVQFTISMALIAGTILVFQQLRYVNSTNLGFNKENILLIKYADKLGSHLEAFQNEIKTYPGVTDVGIAMEVPGGGNWADSFVREGSDVSVDIAISKIDDEYFRTLNFELVAGRGFDKQRLSDKNAIIPNETTTQLFGWTPEQAIGQYLIYPGNDNTRHQIIGVMKDSHYWSLHEPITPIMFCNVNADIWGDWRTLTIKFNTDNVPGLIHRITNNWNKSLDDTPIDYSFLDQTLAAQYKAEERLGSLFGIFSGLSILIAIIGLVGLVSYSAEVRQKEMGIRKVFGASASQLIVLMNRQYLLLIAISIVLATPFTWWAISYWLESFTYKITISPLAFAGAGLCELMLAFISVGYLSIKAATLNPTNILKEE